MKKLFILFILISTPSLAEINPDFKTPYEQLEIKCIRVGSGIERCENSEIICYSYFLGGKSLICKFKEVE